MSAIMTSACSSAVYLSFSFRILRACETPGGPSEYFAEMGGIAHERIAGARPVLQIFRLPQLLFGLFFLSGYRAHAHERECEQEDHHRARHANKSSFLTLPEELLLFYCPMASRAEQSHLHRSRSSLTAGGPSR